MINYEKCVAQEELILEASELICELLDREGVSRQELAQRLERSKGFVSQVLNTDRNMTLRTLADFADALGYRVELTAAKK